MCVVTCGLPWGAVSGVASCGRGVAGRAAPHPCLPIHPLHFARLPPGAPAQLEEEKAATSDKQSRVIGELREAQGRLKTLERDLKHLQQQQKSLHAQKQVRGRGAGCLGGACRCGLPGGMAWALELRRSRLGPRGARYRDLALPLA